MQHHPTQRFTGLAETYARCRPSYPSDAIDFIVALSELKDDALVVDVGCGTGISSRLFAERGLHVLGVEPNDDMRGQAEQALKSDEKPRGRLEYADGTAEETGLANGIADLVICAQAFHWFDQKKALAEFHRILKPQGWLALIWNERDESDPFTEKYGDIFRTARDTAAVEGPRQKAGNALLESNIFQHRHRDIFQSSQWLDEDGLIGRAFSASYAPRENPERAQFETALRLLFKEYAAAPEAGVPPMVLLHYGTSIYTGQRLDKS